MFSLGSKFLINSRFTLGAISSFLYEVMHQKSKNQAPLSGFTTYRGTGQLSNLKFVMDIPSECLI